MAKKIILITNENGLHTRMAAVMVHEASKLKSKYGINILIKKLNSNSEPLAISMLALISLKVQKGDLIEISSLEEGEKAENLIEEFYNFIKNEINVDNNMNTIDDLIEENTIANKQILENIPIGIIVIDANCKVTTINNYALKRLNAKSKTMHGKHILDVIPNCSLPLIIKDKIHHLGKIQHINNHIVIVNRAPIISKHNEVLGAIAVFQDISELIGIKELNEKFKKILECSNDLICFVDENRKISYINPSYEKYFSIDSKDLIGADLKDISPNGLRLKVFKNRKTLENVVYSKDDKDLISTVQPIFIDDEFKGVISLSKPISEIQYLMNKLKKSEEELQYYKKEMIKELNLSSPFNNLIGNSLSLKKVLFIAEKASDTTSTVLIRGESGTGKELIAKAIHYSGKRKNKPFIKVNCAAIPENLLESELFGYEKGAFTGAFKNKPGKFNLADGGTIFLDEIGDMPLSMQTKLLRVLQEMEFESVGGITTQKVNVRVLAATNKDLNLMMKEGTFREDLYYRLNVISLTLPPLRDRKEDIRILAEHFICKINKKLNRNIKSIDEECIYYLEKYNWPGNIRELENVIERAINMCDAYIITPKDLPLYITDFNKNENNLINFPNNDIKPLEVYEKEIIKAAMKKYKSYNKAGKALGITHRTVALKCKKYGIKHE